MILTLYFICFQAITAQVKVRAQPLDGFEDRIRQHIDTMRIIDTHEHLVNPSLMRQIDFLDFTLLINHYYYNDLISAGMPPDHYEDLFVRRLTPVQKWDIIEPYWNKTFNTTHNRIAVLAAQKLYNVDDINRNTVDTLSRRIAGAYQKNWPKKVLTEFCRIDYLIQDGPEELDGLDNVLYVKKFTEWVTVRSKGRIDSLFRRHGEPVGTLERFLGLMEQEMRYAMQDGIVAVKITMAYQRSLKVDYSDAESARRVFRRIKNGGNNYTLTYSEAKPLQDFIFHYLMVLADKYRLPVAIHTGYLSGNGNRLENSNPLLLADIFKLYPTVNFSLFHGGYPFGGEISSLAKSYPNVYIDLNWMYAISPSYSERYLHEWFESVPVGKIMGFGGDYRWVDNIYGELIVAKEIIARVLIKKVSDGYFSEEEALRVAEMILSENARIFYGLF